jgi:hypothetical protein
MAFMPSLVQIVKVMEAKSYRLYRGTKPQQRGLNIVGIRSRADSPDKFDDTIAIFYLLPSAADLMLFAITTDPSPYYLKKPIKGTPGTAILKEGQYKDVYKIATHKPSGGSGHTAVCQRLGEVTVWRDNTKDGTLNYVNPQTGMFGINIHKGPANGDWDSKSLNYSAGCQVFADLDDFALFMKRCNKEMADTEQNVFTYTLLNEKDFD